MKNHLDKIYKSLSYKSPVDLSFGVSSIIKLKELNKDYGKKCLVITGPNIIKTDIITECRRLLEISGHKISFFSGVNSEPTTNHINKIKKQFHSSNSNFIIGIGGGSALDAAKAASVITYQGGYIEDYFTGKRKISKGSTPLVLIPTTAGSGAELSKGAIISWPEENIKTGLRGEAVYAKSAIVDPYFTSFAPHKVIKVSGFDVFTHAVETYISKKSNSTTAEFSLLAIEGVTEFLPKLLKNPDDSNARTVMSFFSMLMGFNLANSSTCLPHRLQYPLGEHTKTPHALGLAAMYPAWVKITLNQSKEKFSVIAQRMSKGLIKSGLRLKNKDDISYLLKCFMNVIDLNPNLSEFGLCKDDCTNLSLKVTGSLDNDPWWKNDSNLLPFYLQSL